ncbi:hypothetical protein PMIT1306_02165 [Prochlorococcus sp. MIT 1306]|nr:hypothetical protein PMIT1306_02165 [Prochlorococcus sp. MIT 1306]
MGEFHDPEYQVKELRQPMPPLPPQLIRRALLLDVVLALVFLSLSLFAEEQVWRLIWGCGALLAVVDALIANRFLDEEDLD